MLEGINVRTLIHLVVQRPVGDNGCGGMAGRRDRRIGRSLCRSRGCNQADGRRRGGLQGVPRLCCVAFGGGVPMLQANEAPAKIVTAKHLQP